MRILMIAPQPFFEPRGAPFCVYQHIKALSTLGHEVDLVTYPIGQSLDLPNLSIYRAPSLPFIRAVKPGFSLAKFPLDLLVFLTALWMLCRGRYRYIYTHEEAALLGALLAPVFGCKHLYYMHCDLSELVPGHALVVNCVKAVQAFMVRRADAVIAFYPKIATAARAMAPGKPIYLILPPAVDEGLPPACPGEVMRLKQQWQPGPLLLYTGTLERYQGIDLLIESARIVHASLPEARYLIVGGKPEQVAELRLLAQGAGLADVVHFIGQRPLEEMPNYMALADVLLSPRSQGTHTPLKLYTYLRSGKPLLATDILSHTQILTPEIALLVPPTPEGLALGALMLLQNPMHAWTLGECGRRFAQEHYSWPVFLEKNRQAHTEIEALAR